MTSSPSDRLRTDARRISRSDSPIGRAMPKIRPLGSLRATISQSPTRRGLPSAAAGPSAATPNDSSVRRCSGSGLCSTPRDVDRERNLSLIAPREREHRPQRAIEIERRVGLADDLAVLLDGDLDAAALDLHLHLAGGAWRLGRLRLARGRGGRACAGRLERGFRRRAARR